MSRLRSIPLSGTKSAASLPGLDIVSSPIASPIRKLAGAATDNGRRAPEFAVGIGLREVPPLLLRRRPRQSEARRSRWGASSGGMGGGASWKGHGAPDAGGYPAGPCRRMKDRPRTTSIPVPTIAA